MSRRNVVFLINLLQDVNIVRPLALLAARDLGAAVMFLLSHKFIERDTLGIWQAELRELRLETGATVHVYDSEFAALRLLRKRRGVLVAASESNLSAHEHTHNVFRAAPPEFLRVTLQHGYECVGFLQNRDHIKAHGRNIGFAADVVCGWCDISTMRSLAPSERSKYLLTGPTALLPALPPLGEAWSGDDSGAGRGAGGEVGREAAPGGVVCENLHSVRMRINGDFKAPFMDTFFAFCARLEDQGKAVTLRPHPGGQYVLKNNVQLPAHVRLNNLPMYKVDLCQYAYGISAPSSVVIDMVLAGIPAAVWQDEAGALDASSYEGLRSISTLADWLDFEREATEQPQALLAQQARFLLRTKMLTDRQKIHSRFAQLLANGLNIASRAAPPKRPARRIMFVANSMLPTLQLSFLKPLQEDVEGGAVVLDCLTGEEVRLNFESFKTGKLLPRAEPAAREWIRDRIEKFAPSTVVFCRYSDNFSPFIVDVARSIGAAVVYHVDDDLLNVPIEIGRTKHLWHNAPHRIESVTHLLNNSDLVYCSTPELLQRYRELGFKKPMVAGDIYCAGSVIRPAVNRPVTKIGYMGFDHAHDLALILPALVATLRKHPTVTFDLFGSIPKPDVLNEFGDRITIIPPVKVYAEFLQEFSMLNWDIGLCPLASTPFNRVKANTKWVEYTSVGVAVVATRGMAYDDCCAAGCGELAGSHDEWVAALDTLCSDRVRRYNMVVAAQSRLQREYTDELLRDQILAVLQRAQKISLASVDASINSAMTVR